jgi:tetratricopeptide (TPR) repeat protein
MPALNKLAKREKAIAAVKRASAIIHEGLRPETANIAISNLKEALRCDPTFTEAHTMLARCYMDEATQSPILAWWWRYKARGELWKAVRSLPEGDFPEKGDLYATIANNLIVSGKRAAALKMLDRAIQTGSLPAKLWAYARKGEIYYQQGKTEQAIQVWTRSKALEPPQLSQDADVPRTCHRSGWRRFRRSAGKIKGRA